jgi:curli biogenesis system outer membrane secretion channel CsgG
MSVSKELQGIFLILFMLVYGCTSAPAPVKVAETAQEPSTVAIWDFDNLTPSRITSPDLGELLAAEATETIMRNGNYQVVERQRLLLVLEEQNLGTQSFVDESTRLRLGKMLGARMMIFGAYQSFGGEQTRLDLRLVDVQTGRTLKCSDKIVPSSNFQAWYEAVRQAVNELLC